MDIETIPVSKAPEIKVRRAALSDVLHGKAALTPEMALRIEKAFGPDMNHLLRMEQKTKASATPTVVDRHNRR